MTDKVQKIREGVEKLKSQLLRGACSSQIAMETMCKEEAYNEVLAILDTMQEEHVSIWHDASKTPIKGKIILVVQYNGFPFLCEVRNDIGYVSLSFDHRNKTKIDENDKWAYIDDLLKM